MDSYLKEILSQPELTTAQYRIGFAKLSELRKHNARIKREMTTAKKDGDMKRFHVLNGRLKSKEKIKLENRLKGRTSVDFDNKVISVKKRYLKKLKDPKKYIENLYVRSTKTQIKKLKKAKRDQTAQALFNKLNGLYPDNKKVKEFRKEAAKAAKKDKGGFWDSVMQKLQPFMAKMEYDTLFTVSKDGAIKVIYIRKG